MNIREVLQQVEPLTDEQILAAQQEAVALTVKAMGAAPDREQFERYHASHTPRAIALVIGSMLGAAALAAFAMSVFRVFTAGRDLFLTHIDEPVQAAIAGVATFMLAELLVIGSMLARAVYFKDTGRRAMLLTAAIGVSMALAGNLVISNPPLFGAGSLWEVLFAWLDALAPPVSVLLITLAFERMVIHRVQAHQEIETAYQSALNAWKAQQADPETSEMYQKRYLPRAIKRAIVEANSAGRGSTARKELMQQLRPEHWNYLVLREVRAADWYNPAAAIPEMVEVQPVANFTEPVMIPATNGNGRH